MAGATRAPAEQRLDDCRANRHDEHRFDEHVSSAVVVIRHRRTFILHAIAGDRDECSNARHMYGIKRSASNSVTSAADDDRTCLGNMLVSLARICALEYMYMIV